MNITLLFGILARAWWVILLALVVTVGATAFFTFRQPAIFEARAMLVLGPSDKIMDLAEFARSVDSLGHRNVLATYAKMPLSRAIVQKAYAQAGVKSDLAQFYPVRSLVVPDTNILEINVEGPDPQMASAAANALAEQVIIYGKDLYSIFVLKVLDPALPPNEPIRPEKLRNIQVGIVIGLLIGVALAFLAEYARGNQADPDERVLLASDAAMKRRAKESVGA